MSRYNNLQFALADLAQLTDELHFTEIGTYDGVRASQLIKWWLGCNSRRRAFYYGFDLFEDLTPQKSKAELSKTKLPPAMSEVHLRMTAAVGKGAVINLYKGDTTKTLPAAVKKLPRMSLIFQDGGHSLETVRSDWQNASRLIGPDTIYLFDDYYVGKDDFGCGPLVRELAGQGRYHVRILDPEDSYEHTGLKIRMARVQHLRAEPVPEAEEAA